MANAFPTLHDVLVCLHSTNGLVPCSFASIMMTPLLFFQQRDEKTCLCCNWTLRLLYSLPPSCPPFLLPVMGTNCGSSAVGMWTFISMGPWCPPSILLLSFFPPNLRAPKMGLHLLYNMQYIQSVITVTFQWSWIHMRGLSLSPSPSKCTLTYPLINMQAHTHTHTHR